MIRPCRPEDIDRLYLIINEAAKAYEGVIPADCYHQPYMTTEELRREMGRITFYGWEEKGELVAVAGMERVKDVTLLRHGYVLPEYQRRGIGSKLMEHMKSLVTTRQLLVGMWAANYWSIAFCAKHGFRMMPDKDELLKKYWDIPARQIETSVVMGFDLRPVLH